MNGYDMPSVVSELYFYIRDQEKTQLEPNYAITRDFY